MDVCSRKKSQMHIPIWKHKSVCSTVLRNKNLEILQDVNSSVLHSKVLWDSQNQWSLAIRNSVADSY